MLKYDEIIKLCRHAASERGLYYVLRIQNYDKLSVHINNGKTEEISTGKLEGLAIQVFTEDGRMGFAAVDRVTPETLMNALEKAAFLAEADSGEYLETNLEIFKLQPLEARKMLKLQYPHDCRSLSEIEQRLHDLNDDLIKIDSRLSVRTVFSLVDEQWRISRSDGTDVTFNTPRSFVFHAITAKDGGKTSSTTANLPGNDLGVLLDCEKAELLRKRAHRAADLALKLLDAPKLACGNYKLVIDYSLAKGLAHEAFGHAAETDNLESSLLGDNGVFRAGLKVADERLSIIDGPIEGDYAYQPFSAVGSERQTVRIVDNGILKSGLADIFSANSAGVEATGAERVESCFALPIARMSNIRIEWRDSIELNDDFEDITPNRLYQILSENNLTTAGEQIVYLTGFSGGQVNPAFGDFVFNCSAIYDLSENSTLYQPAIFSGKILSVLQSVSAALGELKINVMGTCGKMGQGVPSSGGSHCFLIIEANPEVMIGGN